MLEIILIIIGVGVLFVLLSRKSRERVVGVCASTLDQTIRKNTNKEKILTLLKERGELSNFDIRKELGVSATSVVRYMDELERESKVEQIGSTGHTVTYRLLK